MTTTTKSKFMAIQIASNVTMTRIIMPRTDMCVGAIMKLKIGG